MNTIERVGSYRLTLPGMRSSALLPLYFPTSVIHIENHSGFSSNLKWLLDDEVTMVPHSHPDSAFRLIEAQRALRSATLPAAFPPGLPLRNSNRFELVSTAVIDYRLLGVDGLSICQSLTEEGIERVMLSGQISAERAERALKDGDVLAYIDKSTPDFHIELLNAIHLAQQRFFRRTAIASDAFGPSHQVWGISDSSAAGQILEILNDEPTEMYWQEDLPGMLFVSANGKIDEIIIVPMAKYQALVEQARTAGASSWYLDQLATQRWAQWTSAHTLYDPETPPSTEKLLSCRVIESTSGTWMAIHRRENQQSEHVDFLSYDRWRWNRDN